MGAFGQLDDDESVPGVTTIAVRLKYSQQGTDLIRDIPGVSQFSSRCLSHGRPISLFPNKCVLTVTTLELKKVADRARDQGLTVTDIHIRGKVHNPENASLVKVLFGICQRHAEMSLPDARELRVPVRSNLNGKLVQGCSLTYEAINATLASRCEWYQLLKEISRDLSGTNNESHTFVLFGFGDVVSLLPFHNARLQIRKVEAYTAIQNASLDEYEYPEGAIAITGAACRLPKANDLEELWNLLSAGVSTCEEIRLDRVPMHESFRAMQNEKWKPKWFGNFIDGADEFDWNFFRSNVKAAANMDPQQRILLELTYEALDSAGYLRRHRRENGDNVGCFIGASYVEYADNTNAYPPTAYSAVGTIRAFLCGKLSHCYGWTGPAEVIDTACSSSLVAINRACRSIQSGECPMAIAGGVNIISSVHNYLNLGKAGFLSPTGQCKPFDESADGYCRGEGAGLVVLKPLKQALADGDQVLAVISGSSTNQGGLSENLTLTHPPAQVDLYKSVLKGAKMSPRHVSYIEAHGTGTSQGDPLEISSIREVFGASDRPNKVYLGSIKGNTGHAESAAGVAGLVKVIAMLQKKAIPPHTSFNALNPKIPTLGPDKITIARNLEPWNTPFRAALVNNYGAAGSNAAVVVCEGPRKDVVKATVYPIILSAFTRESLLAYIKSLKSHIRRTNIDLANLAFTLSERRKRQPMAWMTTASDIDGLLNQLCTDISPCEIPRASRKVVLAFAGQSKQAIGLSENLYEFNPRLQHYIHKCDATLKELGYPSIIPAVFQNTAIDDPILLQTGTMAVQYASAKCWIDAGVKPACTIGHSFGELTALAVSGVLSLENALKLVAVRAQLMVTKWGPDKGTMLAVFAPVSVVESIIEAVGNETLEIACFNAPTNQVVVGNEMAVADVEKVLATNPSFKGVKSQRVDVTHGFHSIFTEPLRTDFSESLQSLSFKEASILIEPCTQQQTDSITAEHIVSHLRKPVYFVNAVRRIEERHGDCIWLEAGFDSSIVPMIKRAISDPEGHSFHAIKTAGIEQPSQSLSQITIDLWKQGHDITPWPFLSPADAGVEPIWLPPYQFQKTKAWLDNIDRAIEIQRELENLQIQKVEVAPGDVPMHLLRHVRSAGNTEKFVINSSANRFQKLISGHSVRGRPLFPASLYMECAAMAIQLLGSELGSKSMVFEDLSFKSPLGFNMDREIELSLEETDKDSWSFVLSSSLGSGDSSDRAIVHGIGKLHLAKQPRFSTYKLLLAERIDSIRSSPTSEKIMCGRAYQLFSKVVHYAESSQGIESIIINKNEALATIRIPDRYIGSDEKAVRKHCDTVSIDMFLQVSGLLINSSSACGRDQVFITSGLESVTMSKLCDFDSVKEWNVYAIFSLVNGKHATGDVFVLTKDNEIAMTAIGAKFHRIEIARVEQILDVANGSNIDSEPSRPLSPASYTPITSKNLPELTSDDSSDTSDYSTTSSLVGDGSEDFETRLRTIISTYIGAPADFIPQTTCIGDLGIDSLATIELSDELKEQFGKSVSHHELQTLNLSALCQIVSADVMRATRKRPVTSRKQVAPAPPVVSEIHVSRPKSNPNATSTLDSATEESERHEQQAKLFRLISELCGVDVSRIQEDQSLADLGFDSLSTTELGSSLSDELNINLESTDVLLDYSVKDLMRLAGASPSKQSPGLSKPLVSTVKSVPTSGHGKGAGITDPFKTLLAAESSFPVYATDCQYTGYLTEVAARQDELLLAYMTEGLQKLGVDLRTLSMGQKIPSFSYQHKHSKVVRRYYEILQKHKVIEKKGSDYVRSSRSCNFAPSSQLLSEFIADFPQYSCEAELMSLTGSKLAECLTGSEDPIKLLFGNPKAQEIIRNFYTKAPMFATLTELLVDFLLRLAKNANAPISILEVGAGTGGTTKRVIEALGNLNHPIEYFFTDISPTFVRNASKKFNHPGMQFRVLNLETPPPADLIGKFDIVISTNCVHATTNRASTCRRIKEMLNAHGVLVLSEITTKIDWHEVVFGLLDGWWLANDANHAIQPPEVWMEFMRQAGFSSASYSQSTLPECNLQRLLVASLEAYPEPAR
ncbi:hypothetical protein COCMIDRAFT_102167 [Bipolaris oryzae ATCC 44560]|uniref:S-adenosyl-L-methionine-dependent N-methyltransferase n=1 Tax=Bipolaris oryzae ATCC 44560 TaxID=930090 RepID=W6ZHC2_COCMI|nr:uncharacterized protein COCMIDRAFT_102167 [Bipolaris oryzae ATCC 44560]EUC42946.1 hypothetical protein COCMIDRAFT_102167 [Bipolaris oryzae ATCC 44560]